MDECDDASIASYTHVFHQTLLADGGSGFGLLDWLVQKCNLVPFNFPNFPLKIAASAD